MIGIDTSFLVAYEIRQHPAHASARRLAREYAAEGFALTAQVLSEFAHVVSDSRRFERPLDMQDALERAAAWWNSREVTQVSSSDRSVSLFLSLMKEYRLGRKRIPDTMLAATYIAANVHLILSTNWRDFAGLPGIYPILLEES